ncbi:hypothetical protein HDU93_003855 [Gonapodya sp. JEL0774]|nr:hypothetical protein HDU93_003855 [Gonapodya sp. JEL0774]
MYRPNIVCTNSAGLTSIAIAEFVLLHLLSRVKHLPHHLSNTDPGIFWTKGKSRPSGELAGKVVLVLGMGSIGSEIAKRLQAFSVTVLGARRRPVARRETVPNWDEVYGAGEWCIYKTDPAVLSRVDFLVIAAPGGKETENVVGKDVILRLKKGVHIINIARGSLIDEDALMEAVDAGWVGGAVLDVHRQEPIPATHKLFSYHPDKILLTPHMAWSNDKYFARTADLIVGNAERFVSGLEVLNKVELPERVKESGRNDKV